MSPPKSRCWTKKTLRRKRWPLPDRKTRKLWPAWNQRQLGQTPISCRPMQLMDKNYSPIYRLCSQYSCKCDPTWKNDVKVCCIFSIIDHSSMSSLFRRTPILCRRVHSAVSRKSVGLTNHQFQRKIYELRIQSQQS